MGVHENSAMLEKESDSGIHDTPKMEALVALVGMHWWNRFGRTGCARAILSALDTAWMVREMGDGKIGLEKVVEDRNAVFMKMKNALAGSISKPYHKCSVDPLSRYGSGRGFQGIQ